MLKVLKLSLKLSYFTLMLPVWMLIIFSMWFVPWTLVLHSGLLFYFPYQPNGQERFLRVTGPVTSLWSDQWVSGKNIPQTCRKALVAAEDAGFYQHRGVDIETTKKNVIKTIEGRKVRKGGSTITQQLVKNAFLSRERNYLRKSREITGAILLDMTMSKESQETWYLNIIEFGPKIYGIEQAAQHYFKRSTKDLTPSQCIALMVIIPSPLKWNKSLEKKNLSYFFTRRYFTILARMRQMSLDTRKNLSQARSLILWPKGRKV